MAFAHLPPEYDWPSLAACHIRKPIKPLPASSSCLEAVAGAADALQSFDPKQPLTPDHALIVAVSTTTNSATISFGLDPIFAVNLPPLEPIRVSPLYVKITKGT